MNREVDYLVIGAGIAGMTLYRALGGEDVAIVDHSPERYKIGESIVPPHFFAPELRPVLAEARRLPSAAAKLGTLFVSEEGVSYFQAYYDGQFTIHLDRRELESLYRRFWNIPIVRERVVDVDVERRVVTTDGSEFRVRKQILDCSGPAMIVSRKLGLDYELWPVWAGWSYFDVDERDDGQFWRALSASGRGFFRFDDDRGEVVDAPIDPSLPAGEMTMLTRVRDGVWSWQIPLYNSTLLSFGFVSRHGPIDEDEYLKLTEQVLGAQYRGRIRPWDRSSPHNQFHRRHRFARASREFAGPGWALVGDAAFFGDPVYSVGTGIATNQALRIASLLKRFPWEDGGYKIYNEKTREVFQRAEAAYGHWYASDVTTEQPLARNVQSEFLNGLAFHHRTGELYKDMCSIAGPEDRSDPSYTGDPGEDITPLVPEALRLVGGWIAERTTARNGTLEIKWSHEAATVAMTVALRELGAKSYREAGPFALSYRRAAGDAGSLDDHGRELFENYARVLIANQSAMLSLLESHPAAPRGSEAR